ncbi:hypothetical protein Misp01_65760 [Microtetraspora sp. NBRC 13810]|uniref:IPT/TIG domain-containing protein n=1 Tax=Microtetraspora sp. NBRC 13810 TaxID=3030990 RepID=UPI0024A46A8E|nr:IPT/TIG domain-containing protein [Microtetraspora sp. NBRC 13810]GLW11448.1 hypothetical protein Misp01_65760 [Microtetraspora sp. NBRC 13810]
MRLSTSGRARRLGRLATLAAAALLAMAGGVALSPAAHAQDCEVGGVTPNTGPTGGGTAVTITGDGFLDTACHPYGVSEVEFGDNLATSVTVVNDTTITATTPPGTGTVNVTVLGFGSFYTLFDGFSYTDAGGSADIDVDLGAQPHVGILVPYLRYTLTARNTGPDAVASATLTATLPPGTSATNLSPGCTTAAGKVTCAYGAIADGTSAAKSFRVPLSLLSLGQATVTGVRTTSAPADPDPANDNAATTCTVISVVLVTCT